VLDPAQIQVAPTIEPAASEAVLGAS